MIKINKLKGKIVEQGLTQADVAKFLEISPRTFSLKLKKGIFNNTEIEKMTKQLKIDNPMDIFFNDFMSLQDKNEQEN